MKVLMAVSVLPSQGIVVFHKLNIVSKPKSARTTFIAGCIVQQDCSGVSFFELAQAVVPSLSWALEQPRLVSEASRRAALLLTSPPSRTKPWLAPVIRTNVCRLNKTSTGSKVD